MSKPTCYEELTWLVSALLDGQLSVQESARLESLLQSDPTARSMYMQMIDQEVELSCLIGPADVETKVSVLATLPARSAKEAVYSVRGRLLLAAAAVVLLGGFVFALLLPARWRGEKITAPSSTALQLALPDAWAADFENGALSQWFGRVVSNNLPADSKYGIAMAVREYPPVGPHYIIQLPEDWNRGLFTLTTNSTLHVTYYLGTPGAVNVFMHTLPPEEEVSRYSMFQLFSGQFPGRPNDWRTASIPFLRFVRKVPAPGGGLEFAGGPPEPGERVTTLVFSSLQEIDFVIDRIWITPTGSGVEEVRPLQNANNK
jgi:hypothetical protein